MRTDEVRELLKDGLLKEIPVDVFLEWLHICDDMENIAKLKDERIDIMTHIIKLKDETIELLREMIGTYNHMEEKF